MEKYLTVKSQTVAEYIEKRSKFIATLRPCETEEEAMRFIEEIRSKYWDARHNVFAYSVQNGVLSRFSDDGEPHGTAGKPILDVIQGSGLTNIAIVVTRYFGGVLLGTGGLVRAYSKSAKDAVLAAERVEVIQCNVFETVCEYSEHSRLVALITDCGGMVEDSFFSDKVKIVYCLKESDCEVFSKKISENFSARLQIVKKGEKNIKFSVKNKY